METAWLLTSTTYGTWLAGDDRGSMISLPSGKPDVGYQRVLVAEGRPGLRRAHQNRMKGPPVLLTNEQAAVVCRQFVETATVRGWRLLAASVMGNHFHLVVGAASSVRATKLLGDFKAYASRALTVAAGPRPAARWFTAGGSTRQLPDERAIGAAVRYVLQRQTRVLASYTPDNAANLSRGASAPGPSNVPCTIHAISDQAGG